MANVVSSFPLLRLPEKALTKTLQCMTPIDRFGISWCSERTKQIIVGLNLKVCLLNVDITRCIIITCLFQDDNEIQFTIFPENIPRHFVGLPMKVRVDERNYVTVDFVEYNSRDEDEENEHFAGSDFDDDEVDFDEWDDDDEADDNDMNGSEDERENETSDSDDRDSEDTSDSSSSESEDDSDDDSEEEKEVKPVHWYLRADDVHSIIAHCLEIYHKSQLSTVAFLTEADRFDIDYLRQTLNGFNILDLSIIMDRAEDHQFAHQVVSLDIPAKKLYASALIFENKESLYKVLIQNYDSIWLHEPLIRNQRLILDDLLMINSAHIEIHDALISDKDLNRFLKHWISGSNSRMKYMFLGRRGDVGFNKDTILKGIDHQEFPEGVVRECKATCNLGYKVVRVPSGFNFTRHDHTEATVRMKILLFGIKFLYFLLLSLCFLIG